MSLATVISPIILLRFSTSLAWLLALSPPPARVCLPPWRNLSFQSRKVAGDTLCLRNGSAADMRVVKNSVTVLAFSWGVRLLLMPFLHPPEPISIRFCPVSF